MAMRAYSELYLYDAMKNLGSMFDYAITVLKYNEDEFFSLFISSGVGAKFEHGNPKYVAGISGIDLCKNVIEQAGRNDFKYIKQIDYYDGPEYWLGWVLAYYQWYTALRFSDLQEYGLIPSEILKRYILHEADISKFVSVADSIIKNNVQKNPSRLKKIRTERGITQKQLAEKSGVSLRMIQLYEQRQNNINKASGDVINRLAWVLKCNFYEIMEIEIEE